MYIDDFNTQIANKEYIRNAMSAPMLEKDHELELAVKWKETRDEKALHELVQSYTRLVVSHANKFKHYGLPIGDLIQEGNIGLMEAASRFDPGMENRFSTYAIWWIRASLQDYVLRNWSIVRTGTTAAQKSLFFNLRRLRAQISNGDSNEMLSPEAITSIAEELGVKETEVVKMESRLFSVDQSLNNVMGDENNTEWQDLLLDESQDPEMRSIEKDSKKTIQKWLMNALNKLSPRERKIIKERRLLNKAYTLEKIGNELGISKERVRQLENKALDKMKAYLKTKLSDKETLCSQLSIC